MSILLTLILIVALIVAGLVFFAANTARKVEATVPPCGQFVGIDGQRLHYIDTGGAGPAVVLIHGLGGTLWHYTYALVDKLSGEFRVIAVDRPGSGYSTRPDNVSARLGVQADTLAKFMRALGLKQSSPRRIREKNDSAPLVQASSMLYPSWWLTRFIENLACNEFQAGLSSA